MSRGRGFVYRIIEGQVRAAVCPAPAHLGVSSSSPTEYNVANGQGGGELLTRQLLAVVFDMDGTLTLPTLDFAEMKRRIGVPLTSDILGSVNAMSAKDRARSMAVIEEMEDEANRRLQLQPGTVDLLHFLAQYGLHRALMTRNSEKSVRVFMEL